MFPPTLTIGLDPVRLPRLLSRLFEKVFGWDEFPAKSGKEENSMGKDTKASSGTPAPEGVVLSTDIVDSCFEGRTVTACELECEVQLSIKRNNRVNAISPDSR